MSLECTNRAAGPLTLSAEEIAWLRREAEAVRLRAAWGVPAGTPLPAEVANPDLREPALRAAVGDAALIEAPRRRLDDEPVLLATVLTFARPRLPKAAIPDSVHVVLDLGPADGAAAQPWEQCTPLVGRFTAGDLPAGRILLAAAYAPRGRLVRTQDRTGRPADRATPAAGAWPPAHVCAG